MLNNPRALASPAPMPVRWLRTKTGFAFALVLMGCALLLSLLFSASVGVAGGNISILIDTLFHPAASSDIGRIMLEMRMPRALAACFTGAAFALAGGVMQGVTRNPLADAGLLGVNAIMAADMENSSYQLVARWLAGNIWGTSWYQVKALLPYLLILIPLLLAKAGILDLLLLGEEASLALGVRVERERRILLMVAVALAASCISVSGGIGFIGLVAPHIARKFVGGRHHVLLPVSMLLGGLLLLFADIIGRSLFGVIEIPVGIVISVLAAPYFLILLRRQA